MYFTNNLMILTQAMSSAASGLQEFSDPAARLGDTILLKCTMSVSRSPLPPKATSTATSECLMRLLIVADLHHSLPQFDLVVSNAGDYAHCGL